MLGCWHLNLNLNRCDNRHPSTEAVSELLVRNHNSQCKRKERTQPDRDAKMTRCKWSIIVTSQVTRTWDTKLAVSPNYQSM